MKLLVIDDAEEVIEAVTVSFTVQWRETEILGAANGEGLMAGTVTTMHALDGMQARRVLRAGEALQASDVRRPVVVTKGQTVTMQFSAPGVELTAMGRAMSEGGVGDTVTIQNPASFRMISAIVVSPGTVRAAGVVGGMTNTQISRK